MVCARFWCPGCACWRLLRVPLCCFPCVLCFLFFPAPSSRLRRLRSFHALGPDCNLYAVWRLRWDNHYEEVYWRMTLDALPTAARMRGPHACPCAAAHAEPTGLAHHFWCCPVAQAVCAALHGALGAPPTREAVWLMAPPPGVHASVWRVVCVAALVAMQWGWHSLVGSRQAPLGVDFRVALACRVAATGFWDLLADYLERGQPPRGWVRLPPGHPFYGVVAGRVVVRRPAAFL